MTLSHHVALVGLVLVAVGPASATTVTYIDETALVGEFASLAIGADGLGLIAYQDETNLDLKIAHCSNTACTAATLSTLDTAGNVGWRTTLAIGADGRGLVAYYDVTNQAVKTAHCDDLACSSAALRVIEPANMFGTIGLAIGSDGLPLLAYVDGQRIHTAHCTTADCGTATISDVASTAGGIQGVLVGLGADNLGLLALERQQTGNEVDVRRCQDVACSSLSPPSPSTPGENAFVQPRTLAVPADGRPLIGYLYWNIDVTPQVLEVRVRRCTEPTCSAAQDPTFAFVASSGPDLALQANGLPWFAYAENAGRLVVRRCTDPACTSTVPACAYAGVGNYLSLATGADGRSLVAFQSRSGVRLAVAHDVSDPCSQVRVADVTVTEAPGARANFAVTLTDPSVESVAVAYTTVNASAMAGQDYVAASGILTFPPNTLAAQVPVTVLADGIDEPLESFSLVLSSPAGAVLADGVGVGAIVDADPPPRIVAGTCERVEGDSGSQGCVVPVSLVGGSTQPITVSYATADVTAAAGSDYVAVSGALTFPPLSSSQAVSVPVIGDVMVELDESFLVNLSNPVNGSILDGSGEATIVDDDAPSLSSLELTHGARVTADLAATGPSRDEDLYRLAQGRYSSWEVVVDEVSGDVAPGLELHLLAEDNSTVAASSLPVGVGSARSLRWQHRGATSEMRRHVRVRSASCTSDCGPDDRYRLRLYETTGVIPRFNNSGSQVTVLILQNTTGETVSANADFWDRDGVRQATLAFLLPPRGVQVASTAGLAELAGMSGSITVSHDSCYGGLVGKAVALEPATGFSFDSPMIPRPR